jgi:hypothetical protein
MVRRSMRTPVEGDAQPLAAGSGHAEATGHASDVTDETTRAHEETRPLSFFEVPGHDSVTEAAVAAARAELERNYQNSQRRAPNMTEHAPAPPPAPEVISPPPHYNAAPHLSTHMMPRFDGTTKIEDFVWVYQLYAQMAGWSDERALGFLPLALSADACTWFRAITMDTPFRTTQEAYRALQEHFGATRRPECDFSSLFLLQQLPEETIDNFFI